MAVPSKLEAITGCLLGGAVGDALGLPYEGLSTRRASRLLGEPSRHRLVWGRGLFSDDTEHASLTALALIAASRDDVTAFQRSLAKELRWWFAGLPAGVGMATARACLKLWLGYSPPSSGVWSAGNGAAMRAPILGAAIEDRTLLREHVARSTEITHRDPRAQAGAHAIALAVRHGIERTVPDGGVFLEELREALGDSGSDLLETCTQALASAGRAQTTVEFAAEIGLTCGVSGFVLHTVPVALHAWLRYPDDYSAGVRQAILCGGDTDTVAFLVGSLIGARVGKAGIPGAWLEGIVDWPRSTAWLEHLALQVAEGESANDRRSLSLSKAALLLRNLAFLALVLSHGFRRLGPPY